MVITAARAKYDRLELEVTFESGLIGTQAEMQNNRGDFFPFGWWLPSFGSYVKELIC